MTPHIFGGFYATSEWPYEFSKLGILSKAFPLETNEESTLGICIYLAILYIIWNFQLISHVVIDLFELYAMERRRTDGIRRIG
jgi:hypothetical protein